MSEFGTTNTEEERLQLALSMRQWAENVLVDRGTFKLFNLVKRALGKNVGVVEFRIPFRSKNGVYVDVTVASQGFRPKESRWITMQAEKHTEVLVLWRDKGPEIFEDWEMAERIGEQEDLTDLAGNSVANPRTATLEDFQRYNRIITAYQSR